MFERNGKIEWKLKEKLYDDFIFNEQEIRFEWIYVAVLPGTRWLTEWQIHLKRLPLAADGRADMKSPLAGRLYRPFSALFECSPCLAVFAWFSCYIFSGIQMLRNRRRHLFVCKASINLTAFGSTQLSRTALAFRNAETMKQVFSTRMVKNLGGLIRYSFSKSSSSFAK